MIAGVSTLGGRWRSKLLLDESILPCLRCVGSHAPGKPILWCTCVCLCVWFSTCLCLCEHACVPVCLHDPVLKPNPSPNQETCLCWKLKKLICVQVPDLCASACIRWLRLFGWPNLKAVRLLKFNSCSFPFYFKIMNQVVKFCPRICPQKFGSESFLISYPLAHCGISTQL